jgi:AcrR family transcriptional regulator
MKKNETKQKSPNRQARGQKRIAELLRAAGEVFAEVGYDGATTNAIAAKAAVSPGTLYQFFPNKQAIAEALANEYAAKNRAVHESAFAFDPAALSLHEVIDRTVDPFLAFRQDAPGYDALFIGTVVSAELGKRTQALHEGLKQRIAQLILRRRPHMKQIELLRHAEVSVQIVKGLLPLALRGSAKQRAAGAIEMKLVLERYLAPIVGESQKTGSQKMR